MIELRKVKSEDRDLLWNIHQKYLYDMTNFYDAEMDENGNYHYGYFDAYFEEPERSAFFIYCENTLVGFAMINPYSYIGSHPDHVSADGYGFSPSLQIWRIPNMLAISASAIAAIQQMLFHALPDLIGAFLQM